MKLLPRQIREELQKAFGFLQRSDPERAIACMLRVLQTLRTSSPSVIQGVEGSVQNFLSLLANHPRVHVLLEGLSDQETEEEARIPYRAGKERALFVVLEGFLSILREQELVEKEASDSRAREDRRAHLLATGKHYLSLGQIRVACAFFDRILSEFPPDGSDDTVPVALEAGKALEDANLLREAAALYAKIVDLYPKDVSAYRALIDVLLPLGDLDRAEHCLQKALMVFGEHPKTLLRLALLYERAERKEEALQTVQRVLALDDSLAEAHKLLSRLRLQEVTPEAGVEKERKESVPVDKKRAVSL